MIKNILFPLVTLLTIFSIPTINFAQTIDLGSAANFVLFSTDGAVTNSGISHITGNVGTNNGSSTGFGNVNGVMHDGGATSAQCASDLLIAYNQLTNATPAFFPSSTLGNGQTLTPGVYSITSAAVLNLDLTLNGQGDPNAKFIFQIDGSFSTNADAKVKLINAALACNVYWKVEGLVSMASGTTMRGTIIANNAAINMNTGDTLEGRAFSTAGAVTLDGVLAYMPIGCGSPVLTGPTAPNLGGAGCYAIFSSDGAVTNTGITNVVGDVGSNNGSATGFDPALISGTLHTIPDASTAKSAEDLLIAYNYISTLTPDIKLLYPAQFGNNLVLTPHTYLMQGAATFTDTLFLNAQGNSNAVFVIQINGALSTNTYSKVVLRNGALAKNVYWKVDGAVDISDYSIFKGTIICNNGALSALNPNVNLEGRLLTTTGALSTAGMNASAPNLPNNCATLEVENLDDLNSNTLAISLYPNPFSTMMTVHVPNNSNGMNYEFKMMNVLGELVLQSSLLNSSTELDMSRLPEGIYYYQVISKNELIQTGKLVSSK